MTTIMLKRQFIADATGELVGAILPMDEFIRIEQLLMQHTSISQTEKLAQMEQAARDPFFLADLQETMDDFAQVDAGWWEREQ